MNHIRHHFIFLCVYYCNTIRLRWMKTKTYKIYSNYVSMFVNTRQCMTHLCLRKDRQLIYIYNRNYDCIHMQMKLMYSIV